MSILKHKVKKFKDGTIKHTITAKSDKEFSDYVYNPADNERLRSTKTRLNAEKRMCSSEFGYFLTLTTSNIDLAKNGKVFLDIGANYLRKQGAVFFIQLEPFYNFDKYGFHIHGFSDIEIDLEPWIKEYGYIKNYANIWEKWEIRDKNVYCEPIIDKSKSVSYINKKIKLTKELLGSRRQIYRANNQSKGVSIEDYEEDLETGITELVNRNNIAEYVDSKKVYIETFVNDFNNSFEVFSIELEYILGELYQIKKQKLIYELQNKKLSKTKMELFDFINDDIDKIKTKFIETGITEDNFNRLCRDIKRSIIINSSNNDNIDKQNIKINKFNKYCNDIDKCFISINDLILHAIVTNANKFAFAPVACSINNVYFNNYTAETVFYYNKHVLKYKKNVLNGRIQQKISDTGHKECPIPYKNARFSHSKSYTGVVGTPIPFGNAEKLHIGTGFLLKYLGWVENIPINNNKKINKIIKNGFSF